MFTLVMLALCVATSIYAGLVGEPSRWIGVVWPLLMALWVVNAWLSGKVIKLLEEIAGIMERHLRLYTMGGS